jgi:hypothetical protein
MPRLGNPLPPAEVSLADQLSKSSRSQLEASLPLGLGEELIAVWCKSQNYSKVNFTDDEWVLITTDRIKKIRFGKPGKDIILNKILSVNHEANGIFKWDKLLFQLTDNNYGQIGIYGASSCRYFMSLIQNHVRHRQKALLLNNEDNGVPSLLRTASLSPALMKQASIPLDLKTTFRILTLNTALITVHGIWQPTFASEGLAPNLERARPIARMCMAKDCDVMCFQEVFHASYAKIIAETCRQTYPFVLMPISAAFHKAPSGLLILSKHPIMARKTVFYENGVGDEKFASKGYTQNGEIFEPFTSLRTYVNNKYYLFRCRLLSWL